MPLSKIGTNSIENFSITSSDLANTALDDKGITANTVNQALKTAGTNFSQMKNKLINGDMIFWQRGSTITSSGTWTTNSNDSYVADRWYNLSDGNDIIDYSRQTADPAPRDENANAATNFNDGGTYYMRFDVETANKKFGIAQIVEGIHSYNFAGKAMTLSFKARVSATTNLDNVKAAVIAWKGTANSVTSNFISTWNAEGTNPTFITNATIANDTTPANLNVTTTWQKYVINATIPDTDVQSLGNLIVFIWSDVTTTSTGEFLYLADVQLEEGTEATAYDRRPHDFERDLCRRYFQFAQYEWGHCQNFDSYYNDGAWRAARTGSCGEMRTTASVQRSGNFNTTSNNNAGGQNIGFKNIQGQSTNFGVNFGYDEAKQYWASMGRSKGRPTFAMNAEL